MRNTLFRSIFLLFIVLLNVGCDQVSKMYVRDQVNTHKPVELLGDFLVLIKVENEGAFLSMGSDLPMIFKTIFLLGLPAVFLLIGLIFILRKNNFSNLVLIGMSFILGGGIGNIFDRIAYGSVTDFLNMGVGGLRTGIFNLADVSIMLGTFILMMEFLIPKRKKSSLRFFEYSGK